jgi:uncharacterized membrane protein YeaQ/YmgE (transglycosylase-associated protein family)
MWWLITTLVTGLIAGFLAGLILKGGSLGLVGNLILGVVGAFVGAFVLGIVGIGLHGPVGNVIEATLGAVGVLWVARAIKR